MDNYEIRAAALDSAVRSLPEIMNGDYITDRAILNRAETFAYYIETGVKS